jgi:hypothetical protein
MNKNLLISAFFILFLVPSGAFAEVKKGSMEDIGRPSPETGPTKVQTVIGFLDIDSINTATQIFEANVFIGLTWKDHRLAHSGSGPVKYPLDKIWSPPLQIANEVGLVRKTFPEVALVQPDGTVSCKQRYVGTFSQALNLKDFPFDQHKFVLQLIAPGYTPENIQFVPDKKWIDRGVPYAALISKDLSLPDWEITEVKAENTPYFIVEGFGLAGYTFEFKGKRHVEYYLLKVIMPLILIVMMSWACFWIDPENSGTQIGVASTSMLTLIAYRFAIDSYVPKVSYTTRLDEFIFMSTVVVFIALVQVVTTSMLFHCNKVPLARKIDIISRIFFPLVFFSSTFLILLR